MTRRSDSTPIASGYAAAVLAHAIAVVAHVVAEVERVVGPVTHAAEAVGDECVDAERARGSDAGRP